MLGSPNFLSFPTRSPLSQWEGGPATACGRRGCCRARPAVPGAEVVRARGARLRQHMAHTDVHARRSVPATRPPPASLQVCSPGLRFRLLHWAVWRGGKSVATGSGGWPGPRSVPNELAPWALVSPSAQEPLPALGPGAQGAHTPSCGGSRDIGRQSAGQVGGGALRVGLRCRLPEGPVLLTSESPPQSLPPACRLHVPGA